MFTEAGKAFLRELLAEITGSEGMQIEGKVVITVMSANDQRVILRVTLVDEGGDELYVFGKMVLQEGAAAVLEGVKITLDVSLVD